MIAAKHDYERPRAAETRHRISDPLAESCLLLNQHVRVAACPKPNQLLRRVKLPPQHREHVHPRVRFALQQNQYVAAVDLDRHRVFGCDRVCLVRCLFEHGGEAEKFARRGLIDDYFLMVLVHRRHLYGPGDEDVGFVARIADLVDALPWRESPELHLSREDGGFVVIQQREQRDLLQCLWRARHSSPLAPELNFGRYYFALRKLRTDALPLDARKPTTPRSFRSRGTARRARSQYSARIALSLQAAASDTKSHSETTRAPQLLGMRSVS